MIRQYINSYKLASLYQKRGTNIRRIAMEKYEQGKSLKHDDPIKASELFFEATELFYDSSDLYYKSADINNTITCINISITLFNLILLLFIRLI
jgi:hypothetical protein